MRSRVVSPQPTVTAARSTPPHPGQRLGLGSASARSRRDETHRDETLPGEALRDETLRDEALRDETPRDETPRDETLRDETLRDETPLAATRSVVSEDDGDTMSSREAPRPSSSGRKGPRHTKRRYTAHRRKRRKLGWVDLF